MLYWIYSFDPCNMLFLQRRKMKHREGKWLTQSHTAVKVQIQYLNPGNLISEPEGLTIALYCFGTWVRSSAKSQCLHPEGQIFCHGHSLKGYGERKGLLCLLPHKGQSILVSNRHSFSLIVSCHRVTLSGLFWEVLPLWCFWSAVSQRKPDHEDLISCPKGINLLNLTSKLLENSLHCRKIGNL